MGDPNIHKLLQKNLGKSVFEAELEKLCQERLNRFKPLFTQIDFDALVQKQPHLKFLDLGCNDGTILLALKRLYPSIEAFGVEHRYAEYKSTYELLQSYTEFTIKGGSWYDDVYPRNTFDIVSSIHAWPSPQEYLHREDEIQQARATGKMYQEILFDKDFSINELKRFIEFVKPGGYLILKTWQTPLEKKKSSFYISKTFPFVNIENGGDSFNITQQNLKSVGTVIYLHDIYLILQKES